MNRTTKKQTNLWICILVAAIQSCTQSSESPDLAGLLNALAPPPRPVCAYPFNLPPGAPPPPLSPEDCPTTEQVSLGLKLFYEKDLSANQTQSCATCHNQSFGFTDGLTTSVGSTGDVHPRNSQGLANVMYMPTLTWARPDITRLDAQALNPLLSVNSVTTIEELNLFGQENLAIDRLNSKPSYPSMFGAAFGTNEISITQIARALAAFEFTMVSFQSDFDRGTMSASAQAGRAVFESNQAGCLNCHSGPFFNGDRGVRRVGFHNIGLYNVGGTGDYPDQALHGSTANKATQGLYAVTGNSSDRGKFRTPSLRNVDVTGPYMHDGSMGTLAEVIEHYDLGGRNITTGAFAGDGRANVNKDPNIRSLGLTTQQKSDLVEFLKALTDNCFLTDPALSDPNAAAPVQPGYCR